MPTRVVKTVTVGWLLCEDISSVVFFPPERLTWPEIPRGASAGDIARCPGIRDLTSQLWVVRSPFTFRIRAHHFDPGKGLTYRCEPCEKGLSERVLAHLLPVMPVSTWETPERPLLQLRLPYVFLSDHSVYIEQLPAFMSEVHARFPGTVYGGRFPIDLWPRRINFAFHWVDLTREIFIQRGDPLFYVRFQPRLRDQKVRVVEAERTSEVRQFMDAVKDVTAYTDKTFTLFARAAEMRPPRLVKERRTYVARAAKEAEAALQAASASDGGSGPTPPDEGES